MEHVTDYCNILIYILHYQTVNTETSLHKQHFTVAACQGGASSNCFTSVSQREGWAPPTGHKIKLRGREMR